MNTDDFRVVVFIITLFYWIFQDCTFAKYLSFIIPNIIKIYEYNKLYHKRTIRRTLNLTSTATCKPFRIKYHHNAMLHDDYL